MSPMDPDVPSAPLAESIALLHQLANLPPVMVLELLIAGGLFLCAIVLVAASMHASGRWWLRSFAVALAAFGVTEFIEATDVARWHLLGDIADVVGATLLFLSMVQLARSTSPSPREG